MPKISLNMIEVYMLFTLQSGGGLVGCAALWPFMDQAPDFYLPINMHHPRADLKDRVSPVCGAKK